MGISLYQGAEGDMLIELCSPFAGKPAPGLEISRRLEVCAPPVERA
jgi:hypothetical protein